MKPKILYLITSSGWGGAERYVARLAAAAASEFDVTVMAGTSKRFELFRALPVQVHRHEFPELKHPIAPFSDLAAILKLRKFIDRENIDILHCNSTKAGLVGALAAAFSKRKPKVVFTAHGWGFLESRSALFRAIVLWSERLASRFRQATIVLSEKERGVALRYRLSPPDRLHLVPHGLDAGEIAFMPPDQARAELGRRVGRDLKSAFVIGTVANAYPSKALPSLIETFSSAFGNKVAEPGTRASQAPPHLIIIGDGPEMSKVERARETSAAKVRVHLLGAIDDAAKLMPGFDLFVLASLKEGMPWAILEALAAGLPIVATRVGAITEMIEDGAAGLLVEPGDRTALSEALRRLHGDPDLRRKLKEGAVRSAGLRTSFAMINETLGLYRQLL